MKLINKSSKVVFVGTQILMPDHSIDVGEDVINTPGVQALLNRNPVILEIDNSAEKAAEAKEAEEKMRAQIAAEERAKIEAEMKTKAEAGEAPQVEKEAKKTTAKRTAKSVKKTEEK